MQQHSVLSRPTGEAMAVCRMQGEPNARPQRRRVRRCGTVLGTLLLALLPQIASACAVCWEGDDALARGMNVSILFLMSMPFLIGGSIAGVLYVAHRRTQGQRWQGMLGKKLMWSQKENVQ